jgi:hypothetical protein
MATSVSVLAIDPGETVGWATGIVRDGALEVPDYGNTKSKTFLMTLLAKAWKYDFIVYEDYRIRADKLRQHVDSNVPTIQVIGGIRLAAWSGQAHNHVNQPRIVVQQPRDKRTGAAAAQLYVPKLVPVIQDALTGPHDDGHFADALLHLIAWHHKREASHGQGT